MPQFSLHLEDKIAVISLIKLPMPFHVKCHFSMGSDLWKKYSCSSTNYLDKNLIKLFLMSRCKGGVSNSHRVPEVALCGFHYSVPGNCSPCVKGLLQLSSVRSATHKWLFQSLVLKSSRVVCRTHLTRAPTNTGDFGTASTQTACTKVYVPWMLDCRGSRFRGGRTTLWNLNQWFLNSELCPPLLSRLTV